MIGELFTTIMQQGGVKPYTPSATPGEEAFKQMIPQLEKLGIKVKRDSLGGGYYNLTMGTNTIRVNVNRYDMYRGFTYDFKGLLSDKQIKGFLSAMKLYNLLRKVF